MTAKGLISKIYKQLTQSNIKKQMTREQAEDLNRPYSTDEMQMPIDTQENAQHGQSSGKCKLKSQ